MTVSSQGFDGHSGKRVICDSSGTHHVVGEIVATKAPDISLAKLGKGVHFANLIPQNDFISTRKLTTLTIRNEPKLLNIVYLCGPDTGCIEAVHVAESCRRVFNDDNNEKADE